MYIHKFPLFLLDFNEASIFWQIFEKYSNIRFHENASSGSRVVACGRMDRQTDMTKLLVDFCNFAKCLKITSKVVETYETSVLHSGNETQKKKKGWKTAVFHFLLLKLWCGAINQIALEKGKGQIAHW